MNFRLIISLISFKGYGKD